MPLPANPFAFGQFTPYAGAKKLALLPRSFTEPHAVQILPVVPAKRIALVSKLSRHRPQCLWGYAAEVLAGLRRIKRLLLNLDDLDLFLGGLHGLGGFKFLLEAEGHRLGNNVFLFVIFHQQLDIPAESVGVIRPFVSKVNLVREKTYGATNCLL